jgi:hypothetical protein
MRMWHVWHLDTVGLRQCLPRPPGVQVTVTAGVPTVWLGLLQHMEQHKLRLPRLRLLVIGGSAAPRAMIAKFELQHGITVSTCLEHGGCHKPGSPCL